ncbi:MAG: hypothetical protein R6X02_13725 [Enhygromyxa sp.]
MSAEGARVQAVLGRVARDPALRDRFAQAPEATLGELGLDEGERAGMLRYGPSRLLAYHEMVHTRLLGTIRTFMGGAAERLGRDRLRAEVDAWIAEAGPKTRYLRDVPAEFLAWARPRWEADASLPPWLPELAAHQVLIRTIRNEPREIGAPTGVKLDLDRPIACNPTVRVLRYRWSVHRLPKQLGPEDAPAEDAPIVIGHRNRAQRSSFFELEPRLAHMLELLLAGKTLREALFGACEAVGETLDDAVLSDAALVLADLHDRHVLLGGVPAAQ